MNNITSQKFFLYARKSTDVEDKQVLSIDAQLTELREYAARENIEISTEIVEKQSAKVPGRPLFNKMIKEIETFGGNILAWNPDRLARNSVDGGKIIYLLDTGKLASLKFPTFWCDNTGQGKFMLNMAFGQSKYYESKLLLIRTSSSPEKQCASPKATLKIRLEKWGEISGRRFAPPTIRSPKNL